MAILIENYVPVVKYNGLNTATAVDFSASPSVALPGATTIGGSAVVALGTITSSSNQAFSVGLNGATNPAFNIDSSTALQAAGLNIIGASSSGTVAVAVISSGGAANLSIDAKSTGTITIGGTSSGLITLGHAVTITTGALTVTNGDIVVTANASTLSFTGTGSNGGVLKNLKNAAASSLSGTNVDIQILIGSTPYYFTVYPTKA